MSKEFIIRKCDSCNATIKVLEDCNCKCKIQCCGQEMRELKPNTVDASAEKHIPTYEVKGDKIFVRVNHVMEEEHYIEWHIANMLREAKYIHTATSMSYG